MSKKNSGLFKGTAGERQHLSDEKKGKQPVSIPADVIRFSQTSVNGSRPIIESMKKDGWVGDPIDVVVMKDGELTTIDNTRVVAARMAGLDVKANVHSYDDTIGDAQTARRLATKKNGTPATWGDAVDYRIAKQNSAFRKAHSQGSFTMKKIN